MVYELADADAVLLGQGFELVVEAFGNNYIRKVFLSRVSTMSLRLLFCEFRFLNGSIEFLRAKFKHGLSHNRFSEDILCFL